MSPFAGRPVIGLTGGVGSGKSEVARVLGELGCMVVHSDEQARRALEEDDVRRAIRERFGDGVFHTDGSVDRRALAVIVFGDDEQRAALEAILHPRVERARREAFASAGEDVRAFVIDAPLLMEVGLDRVCDHVIFVDCDRGVRLSRVREHRGWDEDELNRREDAQIALDRKRKRADSIIVNNADLETLRHRVRDVFNQILHR